MKAPANNATGFQDGYRIGIDTCHRQRHNEFEGVQVVVYSEDLV